MLQLCKDPSSTVAVAIRQQVASLLSACSTIEDLNASLLQVLRQHLPPGKRPFAPWQTPSTRHVEALPQLAAGCYAYRPDHLEGMGVLRQVCSGTQGLPSCWPPRPQCMVQWAAGLAPKTRHTAAQPRSAEGHILSPTQRAALLEKHYCNVYTRTLEDPPRAAELHAALGALKIHKAVPAHLAPTAWKLCETEVIPIFFTSQTGLPLLLLSGALPGGPFCLKSRSQPCRSIV